MLHDVAEDQLAFAPRVAGVDEPVDVLALDEPQKKVEPRFAPLDRRELEARWDYRQVLERPAPGARIVLLRRAQFEEVPHRGGQDVIIAFEVVVVLRETAERARDVGGDRRFLGDDELLAHARTGPAQKERKMISTKIPQRKGAGRAAGPAGCRWPPLANRLTMEFLSGFVEIFRRAAQPPCPRSRAG
jgi:hypothetical protein